MAQVTIFGMGGGIWNKLGGDYSGKAPAPPGDPTEPTPGSKQVTGQEGAAFAGWQRAGNRKRRIKRDDEEFLVFAKSAMEQILKQIFK